MGSQDRLLIERHEVSVLEQPPIISGERLNDPSIRHRDAARFEPRRRQRRARSVYSSETQHGASYRRSRLASTISSRLRSLDGSCPIGWSTGLPATVPHKRRSWQLLGG